MLYNKRVKLQVVESVISFVWYQICRDSSLTFIFFFIYTMKNIQQTEAFSKFRIVEPACNIQKPYLIIFASQSRKTNIQ